MPTKYPTAEQIMKNPVDFRVSTLTAIQQWKKDCMKGWKNQDEGTKFIHLAVLVKILSDIYEKPLNGFTAGRKYCYIPEKKIIIYDADHPSIVSTLHEFAHHLFGASEFKSCQWSIWLFKTCFPKTWEGLEFNESPNGLLLIRKTR